MHSWCILHDFPSSFIYIVGTCFITENSKETNMLSVTVCGFAAMLDPTSKKYLKQSYLVIVCEYILKFLLGEHL